MSDPNSPPIRDLNMSDTEYAALLASGYDPNVEQLLLERGESPQMARRLTRFAGWIDGAPPQNEGEWQEFMCLWEYVYGNRLVIDA